MKYLLLALLVLTTSCGFEIVDTGHRGIETRFGKVVGESLDEGLHFYNPITSNITEMDVRVTKQEIEASAYSKDAQVIDVKAAANFHLDKKTVHLVFQEVGYDWQSKLVPQVVQGTLKEVIGQYDAVTLISERQKVVEKLEALLREKLLERKVVLVNFEVNNFDFDNSFESAVKDKVIAVEQAKAAQNTTVRIKEESQQKIIQAQAEAESMKIRSQALSQNKGLVEYEAVQKWNGVLPVNIYGAAPIPFISIGGDK